MAYNESALGNWEKHASPDVRLGVLFPFEDIHQVSFLAVCWNGFISKVYFCFYGG